jgi:hypothetical protein
LYVGQAAGKKYYPELLSLAFLEAMASFFEKHYHKKNTDFCFVDDFCFFRVALCIGNRTSPYEMVMTARSEFIILTSSVPLGNLFPVNICRFFSRKQKFSIGSRSFHGQPHRLKEKGN